MELTESGERRTRVFYCDPHASWQKAHIEKSHEFIRYVLPKRKRRHYTQRNLADRLHVSLRTIMDIENGHTVPRLDTVIAIYLELDISLDAVMFPNAAASVHSKTASDFWEGKSEQEIALTKKFKTQID